MQICRELPHLEMILLKFCVDNSIDIVDHATLPNDTYTYTSYSWGSTSWLDHVLCTADAKLCTISLEVRYDCVLSDHHPILLLGKIDVHIITACQPESFTSSQIPLADIMNDKQYS